MMRISNSPWDDIPSSSRYGEFKSRLVSEELNPTRHKVFWARGNSGQLALLIQYEGGLSPTCTFPLLQNISIKDDDETHTLVFELLDSAHHELFLQLCLDLINSIQNIPSSQIKKMCQLRLEHWVTFLKPDRKRLSPEAQKGLLAELQFLRDDALALLDPEDALKGWVGPEESPRDFEYGNAFIEVKSKRGASNPRITISSENQLTTEENEDLFLFVSELNGAPSSNSDAISLSDIVDDIIASFDSPILRALFESKLAKVGYLHDDDYSDNKWAQGNVSYYAVRDDFPRIDSRSCDPGVSRVNYQINLDYCLPFEIDRTNIFKAME